MPFSAVSVNCGGVRSEAGGPGLAHAATAQHMTATNVVLHMIWPRTFPARTHCPAAEASNPIGKYDISWDQFVTERDGRS